MMLLFFIFSLLSFTLFRVVVAQNWNKCITFFRDRAHLIFTQTYFFQEIIKNASLVLGLREILAKTATKTLQLCDSFLRLQEL